jgi:hypothetical protein
VQSLNKEHIVHLDIERELLADTFTTFDQVYNKAAPLFGQLYIDTKLPWMSSGDEDGSKKKNTVQKLAASYHKHKERNIKKE